MLIGIYCRKKNIYLLFLDQPLPGASRHVRTKFRDINQRTDRVGPTLASEGFLGFLLEPACRTQKTIVMEKHAHGIPGEIGQFIS